MCIYNLTSRKKNQHSYHPNHCWINSLYFFQKVSVSLAIYTRTHARTHTHTLTLTPGLFCTTVKFYHLCAYCPFFSVSSCAPFSSYSLRLHFLLCSYLLPSDLTQSFSFFKINLFIWLYWVLVVAWAIYGTWPPAWGAWSLSNWTTREVPV